MSRKAINRMLRRAEQALSERRYAEAEARFSNVLSMFEGQTPTLLDHAACIYGLVRALHEQGETARAVQLASNAVELLSVHQDASSAHMSRQGLELIEGQGDSAVIDFAQNARLSPSLTQTEQAAQAEAITTAEDLTRAA